MNTMPEAMQVGSGQHGVPRWLLGGGAPVLLSGLVPPQEARQLTARLRLTPIYEAEAADIGLSALASAPTPAAGLRGAPCWDAVMVDGKLWQVVEVFGGAVSQLSLAGPKGEESFDLSDQGVSLCMPRFQRGGSGVLLAAADPQSGRIWTMVPGGKPQPAGSGIQPLCVSGPGGNWLLSLRQVAGHRSPTGDPAGVLQIAPLSARGAANGASLLAGLARPIWDFDADFGPDGRLYVLAAWRGGLELLAGSPEGLDKRLSVIGIPVLHPALAVTSEGCHLAYSRLSGGTIVGTELVAVPPEALR